MSGVSTISANDYTSFIHADSEAENKPTGARMCIAAVFLFLVSRAVGAAVARKRVVAEAVSRSFPAIAAFGTDGPVGPFPPSTIAGNESLEIETEQSYKALPYKIVPKIASKSHVYTGL